jgi:protein-tyrosine phosphatase
MERRLNWASCSNVRDLGGLPAGTRAIRQRAIVRADNLNRLTELGRSSMLEYGVRTVVDLRDPRELEKFPYPFAATDLDGVTVLNVPLISAANWEAIGRHDPAAHPYVMIAQLSAPNIVAAARAIANALPAPVVIHCHEGRERTGVVAAMLLSLAGVSDALIAQDWVLSQPESLKASDITPVLDYMRERGGDIAGFLADSGMSPDEVDALRRRMLD